MDARWMGAPHRRKVRRMDWLAWAVRSVCWGREAETDEVETDGGWSQLEPWVYGAAAGCLDRCRSKMFQFGTDETDGIQRTGTC